MSRSEFFEKYRGKLLLFVTEAWASRKMEPSALGMLLDNHMRSLKGIMDEMYDDLALQPPAPNGQATLPLRKP